MIDKVGLAEERRAVIKRSLGLGMRDINDQVLKVIFYSLGLDIVDGFTSETDDHDLCELAKRYKVAYVTYVNSQCQLREVVKEDVWREVTTMDDPRSLLKWYVNGTKRNS